MVLYVPGQTLLLRLGGKRMRLWEGHDLQSCRTSENRSGFGRCGSLHFPWRQCPAGC